MIVDPGDVGVVTIAERFRNLARGMADEAITRFGEQGLAAGDAVAEDTWTEWASMMPRLRVAYAWGVLETIGALAAGDAAEFERLLAELEQRHAESLEALDEQHGQELRDLLDGE